MRKAQNKAQKSEILKWRCLGYRAEAKGKFKPFFPLITMGNVRSQANKVDEFGQGHSRNKGNVVNICVTETRRL